MERSVRELLQEVFDREMIQAVTVAPFRNRAHPLQRLLDYKKQSGFEYCNTRMALLEVLRRNPGWLRALGGRLLDVKDYTAPASALAEMRAYGNLLSAGFSVAPQARKDSDTPDFLIAGPGQQQLEVEVFAKHYAAEEERLLGESLHAPPPDLKAGDVAIRERVTTPFGKPKPGESVTENAISKLTSTKQEETQFSGTSAALLWLDFQGELWSPFPTADSAQPIRTLNGRFYSGEFWYAFYGREGLSVFEGESCEPRPMGSHVAMRHPGRFEADTKLTAVIVALCQCTFILENAKAKHELPMWFWNHALSLRWFDFASCWVNWPEQALTQRVDIEMRRIGKLSEARLCRW